MIIGCLMAFILVLLLIVYFYSPQPSPTDSPTKVANTEPPAKKVVVVRPWRNFHNEVLYEGNKLFFTSIVTRDGLSLVDALIAKTKGIKSLEKISQQDIDRTNRIVESLYVKQVIVKIVADDGDRQIIESILKIFNQVVEEDTSLKNYIAIESSYEGKPSIEFFRDRRL